MLPINIKFQAYIPQNLGRTLKNFFINNPNFHSKKMINYEEFKSKLEEFDRQYKWLLQPGSATTFFSVDNSIFHNEHSNHTVRFSAELDLKPEKIGKYTMGDKFSFLGHSNMHRHYKKGNQHSD